MAVYAVAFCIAYLTHSFLLIFAFIGVVAAIAFAIESLREKP